MDTVRSRSIALRLVALSVGVVISLLLSFLLLALLNLVVEAPLLPSGERRRTCLR